MGIVEETRKFVEEFQGKHPGKRIGITPNGLELVPETKEEADAYQSLLDELDAEEKDEV